MLLTVAGQAVSTAQSVQRLMFVDEIDTILPITAWRRRVLGDLIARPVELTAAGIAAGGVPPAVRRRQRPTIGSSAPRREPTAPCVCAG